ncbi:hypothetical protein R69608_04182 [Paraburkholderia nemoris]|uniref:DUF2471 domain-containing protein n=1 Tax=Paraburkholderia nemoris TaxID=2793076 RepID=UPI001913DE85|nr:DUF2471 domain-containing protein [Paraburkholderia nemoris]MBK5151744.1 DUF2471 domain-containing protein [Burkholderia sp. R-69608]CAE6922670.1 hypothetical protein R69608_04182 [Paraburkholderia nemoris]
MNNDSALDMDVHDINPVALERALRSASLDLQQIIATVAGRHLDSGRRRYSSSARLPTWRTLLTIDEQVFENRGFLARHNETVRSTFVRFEDSRLSGMDLDEPVDWRRDDDNLPAVYLLVRALVQADATDMATQD